MAASSTIRPSMGQALRACRPSIAPSRATTTSFLSAQRLQPAQIASFSTSSELMRRHTYDGARDNRDNSKHRGESTLRRTGTRWKLSVSDEPLPKPVPREELPRVETDPQHGLWEFFQDRTTVANTPAKDAQHGRAWTVEELRRKSWDDLHRLWWICVKERNRIATANIERRKSSLGFGDSEAQARDQQVYLLWLSTSPAPPVPLDRGVLSLPQSKGSWKSTMAASTCCRLLTSP
ncbi:hypothetical protein GQ53DRAFT_747993 [Thozetella sp. PMI_491]|nr:hypothetical protein GQ53DRAFT_747993 [Thozetella sp. PMI_491]